MDDTTFVLNDPTAPDEPTTVPAPPTVVLHNLPDSFQWDAHDGLTF